MGRAYTRNELLVEVAAAATKLHEVGGMGDLRRYTDDEVFRFGLAYLWLRVAEPACQVGSEGRAPWSQSNPAASASVMLHALTGVPPVDIRIGRGDNSSYAFGMTADYVFLEDLPQADERVIRAHAAELIAMADDLGLSDVRYASDNRLVVSVSDHFQRLGPFTFAEEASYLLGRRIHVYSDEVLKNPGVSPDLVVATPL